MNEGEPSAIALELGIDAREEWSCRGFRLLAMVVVPLYKQRFGFSGKGEGQGSFFPAHGIRHHGKVLKDVKQIVIGFLRSG